MSDLVAPFRGERYAAVERLNALIAPPYDVIDQAERARYAALAAENIVHVMLPEAPPAPPGAPEGDRYRAAAELIPLKAGGYVVDTPGMREVGAWGIEPADLASCFPEFRSFLGQCRFDNCRHLTEPSCAVRRGAEEGAFPADRLVSYERLYEELNVPSWSSGRRRGS